MGYCLEVLEKSLNFTGTCPYEPSFFSFQSSSHQKTRLSGYGVELAIKSTEYKAKDDTKVEGKSSRSISSGSSVSAKV